jgi:hypothetical protein
MRKKDMEFTNLLSLGQGLYYLATGIWPLISRRTFESVTGPKTDFWLVKTLGVLISVIGAVLVIAGVRRHTTIESSALAVGSAAGLAACDIVFVARRRISPVYLLDAISEIGLLGLWVAALQAWRLPRGGIISSRKRPVTLVSYPSSEKERSV